MTAIQVKVQGGAPASRRKSTRPLFLEVCSRSLIILCTALALILSSFAVCDGHWLQAGGRVYGLWHYCTLEAGGPGDTGRPGGAVRVTGAAGWLGRAGEVEAPGPQVQQVALHPNCTTQLGASGVVGVEVGLGLCRSVLCLAVVAAIFGLELQVMSQLSEGRDAERRWGLGGAVVLVAAGLSAGGVVVFVVLLWAYASPLGFTLSFWCQFTAVFLFFLNGSAARHIHHMGASEVPHGDLEKSEKW